MATPLPANNIIDATATVIRDVPKGQHQHQEPTAKPDDPAAQYIAPIKACLDTITRSTRTTIEAAIEAGQHLSLAKIALDHGEWIPWLEQNFALTDRTASRYMKFYKNRKQLREAMEIKSDTVSDLTMAEAEKFISKKKKTEEATTETGSGDNEGDKPKPKATEKEEPKAAADTGKSKAKATDAPEPRTFGGNSPPDVAAETGPQFINAVENWRRSDPDAARSAIRKMIIKLTELLKDD
jgi:hypothetical protein